MSHNDQILIKGLIAKDKNAYAQLYDVYYQALCKFVFRYVRNIQTSEDIVQETFIKLWNLRTPISAGINIKSYLYRAVRNTAIDYINSKVKEEAVRKNLLLNAKLREQENIADSPEEDEMAEYIPEILKRLPANSRQVLELSRYKGLKYKEIAQQLNITVKGVEYHISKALRCLEQELVRYMKA